MQRTNFLKVIGIAAVTACCDVASANDQPCNGNLLLFDASQKVAMFRYAESQCRIRRTEYGSSILKSLIAISSGGKCPAFGEAALAMVFASAPGIAEAWEEDEKNDPTVTPEREGPAVIKAQCRIITKHLNDAGRRSNNGPVFVTR